MTDTTNQASPATRDLSALQRESGGFAMVAVDQREALRKMMAAQTDAPVTDGDLRSFKLTAARILSPHASGILIDKQFALDAAIEQRVVDAGCGLIASGDHFESAHDELVGRVTIDRTVDPAAMRAAGAVAMKLLVLYRPDGGQAERLEAVEEFVKICHAADLISIIEPVSRKPLSGGKWDVTEGILAVADELGAAGADLYKSEIPYHGDAPAEKLAAACRAIDHSVATPWVVLSSGVAPDQFPAAVRAAVSSGASGFLAGRAVWAPSLSAPDVPRDLQEHAVTRLQALGQVVDDALRTHQQ